MPYVPNAQDPSQPTGDKSVASAAPEFRALKTLAVAINALVDNFQAELDLILAGIGAGDNSAALAANLAASTGSGLVGFVASGTAPATRTVQSKLRDVVSVLDFGADPTGVLSSDAAFTNAIATGKRVFIPAGTYLKTSSLIPSVAGLLGEGPGISKLVFQASHGIEIPNNLGLNRRACVISGLSIDAVAASCDDKWAIYVPGVAAAAVPVYNSGLTIRDIEIGRQSRFGGGIHVKDLFRGNFEDIGMTDVSWMIRVVGSNVQCKFVRITSNNDSAAAVLSRYGISTETAVYSSGVLSAENIRFVDCSYIRGKRGINHTAGLLIEFENFDTEADDYGMNLNAPCSVKGGLVAPGVGGTSWVGLLRGVSPSDPDDGTIIDGLDINCLRQPGTPASSYGVDIGDGVSPVYGFVMRDVKIRGVAASLVRAIRGRDIRDGTFEDNFIRTAVATGDDINLTGRRLFLLRNRIVGGNIVLSDGGDGSAYGVVSYNQCAAITFTPTTPNNWDLMFNEGLNTGRKFIPAFSGSTTWDPASIAVGASVNVNVTVTGAAVGNTVAIGFAIGAANLQITGHVVSADTVRVVLSNLDTAPVDVPSSTLTVLVFK